MRDVVIDTDPGIDDALALMLAFASPELRVEYESRPSFMTRLPSAMAVVMRWTNFCIWGAAVSAAHGRRDACTTKS